ncbi:MAG: ATP-dependent helicase [Patescibacteria group bacterium]|nr:ATP-dependent helicase [Patescibacteria group bacterium]
MAQLNFQKDLNKEQYEVVTASGGPHLVLAGAGSGKTRALTYRAAWLIAQGVAPEKILLLTFTNKAANEMMERVKKLLGLKSDAKLSLWGGTFHSLANRLLKIYGQHIGLDKGFTILDSDDSQALLKMIIKDMLAGFPDKTKPSPALFKETISYSANSQTDIESALEYKFPEWLPMLEYFEKVAAEYKKRKELSNVLDFDDLLLSWLKLTRHPEAGKILAAKWQHILVDEYQDTNSIQAEIIFNLAKEHKNIVAVGDDAQSIYSFRAADIKNILQFPEKFVACRLHKLETNYRSTPEILALANSVIAANKEQFPKKLKAVVTALAEPELAAMLSQHQEASYVADRIENFLDSGLAPTSIAVLFRAASHSQLLEMELNKRGISYEMRGGLKFFERAHVKDVLAYLKIIGNFRDEVSWLRVSSLYEGIGPISAQLIYQRIMTLDSLQQLAEFDLSLSSKAASSWRKIHELLTDLIKHKDQGLARLLNIIIENYQEHLLANYTDYRYRQDDLEQLAIFAADYQSLELFLNEMSLQESYSATDRRQSDKEAIVLSTVHQAKGLEWEAVFVINLTDQAFPHPFCVRPEEKEEERRLFYVAITRAARFLCLSYALANFRHDGYKPLKASPFLLDVDSKLFKHNELSRSATYASEDGVQYVAEEGSFLPDVSDW